MRRALRVRSTLAWLTAATLDEDRPLADTLLGSPEPARPRCPPTASSSACRARPARPGPALPDGGRRRDRRLGARPGATTSSPPTRCRWTPRSWARPRSSPAGSSSLPLPEGQYVAVVPRRGGAARRLGRRPAQQGDRRRARATRCGSARASPSSGGGRSSAAGRSRGRRRSWPRPASCAPTCSRRCTPAPAAWCARPRRCSAACCPTRRSPTTWSRGPVRARRARGAGRRRLVRRVRAARRRDVLVIGDVVGHDTEAAACMGQLRGLLRGIAYDSADGPARCSPVWTGDRRAAARHPGDGAGRPAGAARPTRRRRPPAALGQRRSPAAAAVRPGRRRSGARRPARRAAARRRPAGRPHRARSSCERGSTVLLYTDGLVERRDQVFDEGIELLGRALAELRDRPVEELCDELLAPAAARPGRGRRRAGRRAAAAARTSRGALTGRPGVGAQPSPGGRNTGFSPSSVGPPSAGSGPSSSAARVAARVSEGGVDRAVAGVSFQGGQQALLVGGQVARPQVTTGLARVRPGGHGRVGGRVVRRGPAHVCPPVPWAGSAADPGPDDSLSEVWPRRRSAGPTSARPARSPTIPGDAGPESPRRRRASPSAAGARR